MEMIGPDKQPKPLSARYSGPPFPPNPAHGPPPVHAMYEPSWRPYPPPPFAPHNNAQQQQQRRPSISQPPLPSPGYPVFPSRELPELRHDAAPSFARTNSLPAPVAHTPSPLPHTPHLSTTTTTTTNTNNNNNSYRPMNNGTPHVPSPHSAPPEYRPRMTLPPQEQHSANAKVPPPLPPPPHSMPPTAQYIHHPVSHLPQTPGAYDPGYYPNQPFGIRQRKATRAQQVCAPPPPRPTLFLSGNLISGG